MSEIISHKTYEKMFDDLINEEKVNLHDQYIYTHVNEQNKKYLVEHIQSRLKLWFICILSASLDKLEFGNCLFPILPLYD